jgi:uncharacterized membrane protein YdjX (TVP38/TMEM64 family)
VRLSSVKSATFVCTVADVENSTVTKPGGASLARRILPIVVVVVGIAAFFLLGFDRYLTVDGLRDNRAALVRFVAENIWLAALIYMAAYATVIALSVPGGALMTVAGGLLFGALRGTVFVVIAATIGATLLFLIARYALGDVMRQRAGPFVQRMEQGFRANAFSYLLVLRLVPAFPFWAVNLAPALLGVPLSTYVLATAIGIVPGTFVFASFGAGLGAIFDAGGEVSLRGILTPQIIAALVGLAVLALVPVAIKKWKGRGRSR